MATALQRCLPKVTGVMLTLQTLGINGFMKAVVTIGLHDQIPTRFKTACLTSTLLIFSFGIALGKHWPATTTLVCAKT